MKVPYMNNGHRFAAADACATCILQQQEGASAPRCSGLSLHNAKAAKSWPVSLTDRRSLEVIIRKLLQLPGRPALVYVHWWSPTSNQGSASFWNRTVQPGAPLAAQCHKHQPAALPLGISNMHLAPLWGACKKLGARASQTYTLIGLLMQRATPIPCKRHHLLGPVALPHNCIGTTCHMRGQQYLVTGVAANSCCHCLLVWAAAQRGIHWSHEACTLPRGRVRPVCKLLRPAIGVPAGRMVPQMGAQPTGLPATGRHVQPKPSQPAGAPVRSPRPLHDVALLPLCLSSHSHSCLQPVWMSFLSIHSIVPDWASEYY